jgi:hypothetical protein
MSEREAVRCFQANTVGPTVLALACVHHGPRLAVHSITAVAN